MKEIKPHPLAALFPIMPAADIKELADDIKERGLQIPITLFEGKILDGQHRYEACCIAGVKPRFEIYKGKDPLGFVIAANLKRRHLTTSQKAMIAASIANLPQGGDRKSESANQSASLRITHEKAAQALTVSARTVDTASKIIDESPKLAAQVRDGKITVHAAAEKLAEKANKDEPAFDRTGLQIPQQCLALWNRAAEVQKFLSQLSNMRGTLRKAQEADDLLWGGLSYSGALADLGRTYTSIECAKPYAVCPKCQGKLAQKCVCCKGRGMVSQYLWDSTITREEKAMRAKIVEKLKAA